VRLAISEARDVVLVDRLSLASPTDQVGFPGADDGEGAAAAAIPAHADLATSFLPFDRASVERAIDAFLDRFDELGAGLPEITTAAQVVPVVLTVAVAALASHGVMKRRRAGNEWAGGADAEASLRKLSSLSVLWGCGE
jgi:hypothetical protein